MLHVDESQKPKFRCDYKKCGRHENPFFRQDHFRDHLRDFHKEDLPRRGGKTDSQWWEERATRPFTERWWRCNRCLGARVRIDKDGWMCPSCKNFCEPDRQKIRMKLGMGQ